MSLRGWWIINNILKGALASLRNSICPVGRPKGISTKQNLASGTRSKASDSNSAACRKALAFLISTPGPAQFPHTAVCSNCTKPARTGAETSGNGHSQDSATPLWKSPNLPARRPALSFSPHSLQPQRKIPLQQSVCVSIQAKILSRSQETKHTRRNTIHHMLEPSYQHRPVSKYCTQLRTAEQVRSLRDVLWPRHPIKPGAFSPTSSRLTALVSRWSPLSELSQMGSASIPLASHREAHQR